MEALEQDRGQNLSEPPLKPGGPNNTSALKVVISKLIEIAKYKDSPTRIALGMALGIFIGILPIMGIQMAVVSLCAIPLRANLKSAIAGVWISNPITVVPIYYANYLFGLLFVPGREISREHFQEIIDTAAEWNWSEVGDSLMRILDISSNILLPLWLGSAILAAVFCVPTYFFTLKLVSTYRGRGRGHHKTSTDSGNRVE